MNFGLLSCANGSERKQLTAYTLWQGDYLAIVERQTFDKVQTKLTAMAHEIAHLQVLHGKCILSGLMHCGDCNSATVGHTVKSARFLSYICVVMLGNGAEACA